MQTTPYEILTVEPLKKKTQVHCFVKSPSEHTGRTKYDILVAQSNAGVYSRKNIDDESIIVKSGHDSVLGR